MKTITNLTKTSQAFKSTLTINLKLPLKIDKTKFCRVGPKGSHVLRMQFNYLHASAGLHISLLQNQITTENIELRDSVNFIQNYGTGEAKAT